jgi:hypothetical protein
MIKKMRDIKNAQDIIPILHILEHELCELFDTFELHMNLCNKFNDKRFCWVREALKTALRDKIIIGIYKFYDRNSDCRFDLILNQMLIISVNEKWNDVSNIHKYIEKITTIPNFAELKNWRDEICCHRKIFESGKKRESNTYEPAEIQHFMDFTKEIINFCLETCGARKFLHNASAWEINSFINKLVPI